MTEIEIRNAWKALVEIGRKLHPVLYGGQDHDVIDDAKAREMELKRQAHRLKRRRELRRQQAEARAM